MRLLADVRARGAGADNGGAMRGATLKVTLERLGILTSYSRPKVSDDNPYIESLFGTMKTRVGYPKKPFETMRQPQAWVDNFVRWYNEEHRHSGINWLTPHDRHTGREHVLLRRRAETYRKAKRRHPERWFATCCSCWLLWSSGPQFDRLPGIAPW